MPEDKKEEGKEEDDEEPQEQVEFLGKAPKRKETRVSYFHPPLPNQLKSLILKIRRKMSCFGNSGLRLAM